jgi:hypothetical protein
MSESDGRCWVELRVLKISKEQEEERKGGFRTSFPLSIGEVKKIHSRRWVEVKFKHIGSG